MSLATEIHEQPAVLERLLREQTGTAREIARAIRGREVRWVLIAARGSSDNAALYAKYLWGWHLGLPVAMAAPSLVTLYRTPPRVAGALVVGISQSGQSPDIVSVVADGRRQGAPTLAITNDPASPLAAAAELVFDTRSGPERSIAATKTYTAQLLAIAMLATALSGDRAAEAELAGAPELVAAALALEPAVEQAVARHREMTRCIVLGRGFDFATAHEWALKLKELTYAVAEPYSSADFRHGPLAMAGPDFPVYAVVPGGAVHDDVAALLRLLVAERGVDLVAVGDRPEALALARTPLALPAGLPEWLSPLAAIVPGQLWSCHLARAMGLDTEAPRGLTKVTQTW